MHLRPATEAEKRARDVLAFEAWGDRLTQAQFLERELALRRHPFSRGPMTTWLWCDGRGSVLASCESYWVPSVVGSVRGESLEVASVYTEPSLRRRGHATGMLDALVEHAAAQPDAQAAVLFSDVGAAQYARSGFTAFPSDDLFLSPSEGDPAAGVRLHDAPEAPAPFAAAPGTLALQPTAAQLDWHLERERLYARLLERAPLSAHGASAGLARAAFAATFKTDTLEVLWLEAPDAAAAEPVLRCAQRLAHHAGLARVRLWDVPGLSLDKLPGVTRLSRAEELPMARALGEPFAHWAGRCRGIWV